MNKHIFLFFVLAAAFVSCKKNVIEYDSRDLSKEAEFQLHYFVPLESGSENNIYKVEINGELYANNTAPLTTYNAIPSGTVGRFYATKTGTNNIKLYKGEALQLVYDQNCELKSGKQNIFVYDFDKPPVVIDNGFPYDKVITDSTAKVSWIRFYNFLFEEAGVPTTLKLQYQRQYIVNNETNEKSEWINVGGPLSFGEATDWEVVDVNKSVQLSAGYGRVDYRIRMIDTDGSDLGDLQIINSNGKYVNYSDWWNAYVGRRYLHILSGLRTAKPTTAVRQFTAL